MLVSWTSQYQYLAVLKEAENLISQFETKDSQSGWDKEKGRWFPYKSLEGGVDTIGYGEKLFPERYPPEILKNVRIHGITDSVAKELRRIRTAQGLLRLEELVGRSLNDFMSDYQQAASASYIYNVGIQKHWKFTKNLIRAAETENVNERNAFLEAARQEMDIITANSEVQKGLLKRRVVEQVLFCRKGSLA